jgi:hypothetical protein
MGADVSVYQHVLLGMAGDRFGMEIALTDSGDALVTVAVNGVSLVTVRADEESGNRRALARLGDSLQEAYGYAGRALRADRGRSGGSVVQVNGRVGG